MRVLVVHGPNTRLGRAGGYGVVELDRELEAKAKALGVEVRFAQSNSEGALVDRLEQERSWADAVLIEPGPLAHAGWSLREALALLGKPAIEIVSASAHGEPSRAGSIFKDLCEAQLEGSDGFARGLAQLARRGVEKTIGRVTQAMGGAASSAGRGGTEASRGKTIGRRWEQGSGDDERPVEAKPGEELVARAGGADSHGAAPGAGGRAVRESARSEAVPGKSIGRDAPAPAESHGGKSIGRSHRHEHAARPGKSIGRGERDAAPEAVGNLGRALVQQKIRERLSGRLDAPGLADWAKARWLEVQSGAVNPPERDRVEDALQKLALSHVPPSRLSDHQLIELLTELDR